MHHLGNVIIFSVPERAASAEWGALSLGRRREVIHLKSLQD